MKIIKYLLILLLLLMVVALTCYAIPLPGSFPQPWSSSRNLFSAVITGLFGLSGLVSLMFLALHETWQSVKGLDASLANLGLILSRKRYVARYYQGLIGNRSAKVVLRPAYRLEPWRIEITLKVRLGIYLALGNKKPLLKRKGCSRIVIHEKQLEDLHIYAMAEKEAKYFLAVPEVRNPLQDFLGHLGGVTGWEVYLEPDQIHAKIRTYKVITKQIRGWIMTLSLLGAIDN